ncbi:MAG: efflux RND transporter periplasmic adaptor subunit, partial [Gemmatimonadota bacterium]|nr:efflux RND transporter periplasmic adaptor subunit [Gemmatimonadota bacterium]
LIVLLALVTAGGVYAAVTRARRTTSSAPGAPRTSRDSSPLAASAPTGAMVRSEGLVAAYAGADVTIGTEHGGRILRLLVAERSAVARGALLAELDASDDRARLDETRAQIAEANAAVAQVESEVTRLGGLVKDRAATAQSLERATRELDGARARRGALDATVHRLELSIAKSEIRAPFAGTVTAAYASAGEIAAPGARLLRLTDLTRLRVEAEVDEFDASRIHVGAPVTLRAEGHAGQRWNGIVEEVPMVFVARRLTPQDPGHSADGQVLLVKIAPREAVPFFLGQRVDVEIGTPRQSEREQDSRNSKQP